MRQQGRLRTILYPELVENNGKVVLHRSLRNLERRRDFLVGSKSEQDQRDGDGACLRQAPAVLGRRARNRTIPPPILTSIGRTSWPPASIAPLLPSADGRPALCGVEERLRRTLVRLAKRQGRRGPASTGWILAPVPTRSWPVWSGRAARQSRGR